MKTVCPPVSTTMALLCGNSCTWAHDVRLYDIYHDIYEHDIYHAHLASVIFEHSVRRGSLINL